MVTRSQDLPTYSLGGDSCRSDRPPMVLPPTFSSSVLLVSIISLSSVEMTCCCLRGFFLGEAPGSRSPGWEGALRVSWPWEEERAGAGPGVEVTLDTAGEEQGGQMEYRKERGERKVRKGREGTKRRKEWKRIKRQPQ